MKMCVVSDSHGNLRLLSLLAKRFKGEVDFFVHLGDDSKDANVIVQEGLKVVKVPGIFEDIYRDPAIENRKVEDVEGLRILLTHTPTKQENDPEGSIDPEEYSRKVQIVLYGHTHVPKAVIKDCVLWVNPGHFKKEDKKGFPASYALIDISKTPDGAKLVNVDLIEFETGTVIGTRKAMF